MILIEHFKGKEDLSVNVFLDDNGYSLSWQTGGPCGLAQLPTSLKKKVLEVVGNREQMQSTKERRILAHKGGRTEIIPQMRVTKEEKELVDSARGELSYSDFIVQVAKKKQKHTR